MLSTISVLVILLYALMFRELAKTFRGDPHYSMNAENMESRLAFVGLFLSVCLVSMTTRSILMQIDRHIFDNDFGKAYSMIVFTLFDMSNPYLLCACLRSLREKLHNVLLTLLVRFKKVQSAVGPDARAPVVRNRMGTGVD